MTALRNSLLNKMVSTGSDVVNDVLYLTHPLVHAVEQPITNVFHETKVVGTGLYNMSDSIVRLGVYWMGGWLAWTWAESMFPYETRNVKKYVSRAWKRARLEY